MQATMKAVSSIFLLWSTIVIRSLGVILFVYIDPLFAYLSNGLLDALDGPIYKHVVQLQPVKAQLLDKSLDLWLYCAAYFFLPALPSFTLHFLTTTFLLRLIGQFIFFATKDRKVLLYFPNFFEVTYVYVLVFQKLNLNFTHHYWLLGLLYLAKIAHEYILHHKEITIFDHLIIPSMQLLYKKSRTQRASKRRYSSI